MFRNGSVVQLVQKNGLGVHLEPLPHHHLHVESHFKSYLWGFLLLLRSLMLLSQARFLPNLPSCILTSSVIHLDAVTVGTDLNLQGLPGPALGVLHTCHSNFPGEIVEAF